MMATFEGINWQNIGALVALISAVSSIVLWIGSRVYHFGFDTHRLIIIEESVVEIKQRLTKLEDRMDKRFNQVEERLDKLYDLLLKKQ